MAERAKDFRKLNAREHVLKRPDMYLGNVETVDSEDFVYVDGKLIKRQIKVNLGLYQIVWEILSNAYDHWARQKGSTSPVTKISVDVTDTEVSVWNDGAGIPVEESTEAGVLVPELIFGHLLAGSNFDDGETDGKKKREWGGRNGIGAKGTNIFSTEFKVETFDATRGVLFRKTWRDNMSRSDPAKLTKKTAVKGYTRITFTPDFERFEVQSIDETFVSYIHAQAIHLAWCTGVQVVFNGVPVRIRTDDTYAGMFAVGKVPTVKFEAPDGSSTLIVVDCNQRILTARKTKVVSPDEELIEDPVDSPTGAPTTPVDEPPGVSDEVLSAVAKIGGSVVAFVNGIRTRRGGVHVDAWLDALLPAVAEKLKRRFPDVKPKKIKSKLLFIVKATLPNPKFDSQTKEYLTTPKPKVPSPKALAKDPKIDRITRMPFVTHLKSDAVLEDRKILESIKPTSEACETVEGHIKANRIRDRKAKCTLIITEGLSARGTAFKALKYLKGGSDLFGLFAIRGKLQNTRDLPAKKIKDNKEIASLWTILKLRYGVDYNDDKAYMALPYKTIWIMSDQDYDGYHIRGLILNHFMDNYPSLLKRGFVIEVNTPILQIRLPKKHGGEVKQFFDLQRGKQWLRENQDKFGISKKHIRYFKGLGTLDDKTDLPDVFREIRTTTYTFTTDADDDAIRKGFDSKRADDRKTWLLGHHLEPFPFDPGERKELSVTEFIDTYLRAYSLRSLERNLTSAVDGLKESQRKILFAAISRRLTSDLKVAQFGGFVSERTQYQHGEGNLSSTIINMASDYVGANNAPILVPSGNFGSRYFGGEDAASPRYIFTRLSPLARAMYPELDDKIMTYIEDEGQSIEPTWYVPVLPQGLLNGCAGIATGFSCYVPSFSPRDVSEAVLRWIDSDTPEAETFDLVPWWFGFKGTVELIKDADGRSVGFTTRGVIERDARGVITITEMPIQVGTTGLTPYGMYGLLQKLQASGHIAEFVSHCTSDKTNFTITPAPGKDVTDKLLRLETKGSLTNMVMLDASGAPRRFRSVTEIIQYWAPIRLEYYVKRKAYLEADLAHRLAILKNKIRFVGEVVNDELVVRKRELTDVVADLASRGYLSVDVASNEADTTKADQPTSKHGYEYLLDMPIWTITQTSITRFEKQYRKMKHELKSLKATAPKQMWKTDISVFIDRYETYVASQTEAIERQVEIGGTTLDEAKTGKRTGKPRAPRVAKPKGKATKTAK